MDAALVIVALSAVLVVFAALSAVFGADSRDGFTDQPLRPMFR